MSRRPGGQISNFTLLSTPSAPTITSITTNIGSLSVDFTAPDDVGDAAVSSYVVTAVDESTGASTGATGSASPITISCIGGQTVKIRMQALNAYGPGRLTEYDTGNGVYSGAGLWAWGDGTNGKVGDGVTTTRSSPVQIGALTTWSSISAGDGHSLAIKTDGTLWAWGLGSCGRLGNNDLVSRSSPIQIGALTDWSSAASGYCMSAAIKTNQTLWTWGGNTAGVLGRNNVIFTSSPVQVGALTNWCQVSAGDYHMASIKNDNTLWIWGCNACGQLGLNNITNRSSPVQIGSLTNWAQVSAGPQITAAVKTDGTLWAWGRNLRGPLADGSASGYRSSPGQVGSVNSWVQVAVGQQRHMAIRSNGTLWGAGLNIYGELGLGSAGGVICTSTQVGALTNWKRVSLGEGVTLGGVLYIRCNNGRVSMAVKKDGTLWGWGRARWGQIGLGEVINRSSPVQVGTLTDWVDVSPGGRHTVALRGVV